MNTLWFGPARPSQPWSGGLMFIHVEGGKLDLRIFEASSDANAFILQLQLLP